ncbi:MAG: DUF503 domain-containing protein [Terriglobales bacterium]
MPIGTFEIEIHLPGAHSLKDKRSVLRGLKDGLRRHFNVSVAELDYQDLWQRAVVGVAAIGPDRAYLEGLLARAAAEAARLLAAEVATIAAVEIIE